MTTIDLLIKNAKELVTMQGPPTPRKKKQLQELNILHQADVAVDKGLIIDVGTNLSYQADTTINATNKTVLPGFIDPHTHVVFSGTREFELTMKLQGYSYMDILQKGGGIYYTVEKTRQASKDQLISESMKRLDTMLKHGTTTIEAKTGYGLNLETEMKILEVQHALDHQHPIDITHTFLGAHATPHNLETEEYIDILIKKMLPKVKKHATFCDVFCEQEVFTTEQSKTILEAAKKHNLIPKLHADEIIDTNAAALAAQLQAISADHLLRSNKKGLTAMAKNNVIGVLLPATPFSLMMNKYAPAQTMIQLGVPIALATDLNPNCYTENMQFIIQLACFTMKLTPQEAITAATYNAACAINKQNLVGSIEQGKQADIIVLNCENHQQLPYHFGVNLVSTVIKKGKTLHNK